MTESSFTPGLELEKLLSAREHVLAQLELGKDHLAKIEVAIALASGDAMHAAFVRSGKSDGTIYFAVDGLPLKAEVRKTISWDSDACQKAAGSMPFEMANQIFKITYEVSEKVFKETTDEIRAQLMAARTVKYGKPKITLK